VELYILTALAVLFAVAFVITVFDDRVMAKLCGLVCGLTSLSLVAAITVAVDSWGIN